ncbi:hypothetical protein [Mesonia sp.]|uniref:hypothetical protein n=1 Tax=Mesonia sp. TaxID=1960830 RepID=UPI00175849ED|nr:hypothetical protein [Mesonia sp.]HIB38280.1 hypothetical protein [Mesonia sp.]
MYSYLKINKFSIYFIVIIFFNFSELSAQIHKNTYSFRDKVSSVVTKNYIILDSIKVGVESYQTKYNFNKLGNLIKKETHVDSFNFPLESSTYHFNSFDSLVKVEEILTSFLTEDGEFIFIESISDLNMLENQKIQDHWQDSIITFEKRYDDNLQTNYFSREYPGVYEAEILIFKNFYYPNQQLKKRETYIKNEGELVLLKTSNYQYYSKSISSKITNNNDESIDTILYKYNENNKLTKQEFIHFECENCPTNSQHSIHFKYDKSGKLIEKRYFSKYFENDETPYEVSFITYNSNGQISEEKNSIIEYDTKSITENTYEYHTNHRLKKEIEIVKTVEDEYSNNEKTNTIEQRLYNFQGDLTFHKLQQSYFDMDLETSLSLNEAHIEEKSFEYTYDDNQNWVTKKSFYRNSKNQLKLIGFEEREIGYFID